MDGGGGAAAAAWLKAAAEALSRCATGWDDLRREVDAPTPADALDGPPSAARALLTERKCGLFAAVMRRRAADAAVRRAAAAGRAALLSVLDLELFVVQWAALSCALTDCATRPLVSPYAVVAAPGLGWGSNSWEGANRVHDQRANCVDQKGLIVCPDWSTQEQACPVGRVGPDLVITARAR